MSGEKVLPRFIDDITAPWDGPLTEHERAWVEFLRIIAGNQVPAPNLDLILLLRTEMDRQRKLIAR